MSISHLFLCVFSVINCKQRILLYAAGSDIISVIVIVVAIGLNRLAMFSYLRNDAVNLRNFRKAFDILGI